MRTTDSEHGTESKQVSEPRAKAAEEREERAKARKELLNTECEARCAAMFSDKDGSNVAFAFGGCLYTDRPHFQHVID